MMKRQGLRRHIGTVTHLIMIGIVTTLTVSTRQAIISRTLDTDSPPATFMNKDRKSIASSTAYNRKKNRQTIQSIVKMK